MRRRVFLIYILFLFPLISFNQTVEEIKNINVDSLQDILPELNATERIDALNKIALSASLNNTDSSIFIASRAIMMAEEIEYQKGIADGHYTLGYVYYMLDSLKLSVIHYLNSLRIYEQLPPCIEMGNTLKHLSILNWLVGRTDKAIDYNRQEIQLYNKLEVPLTYEWGTVINIAYLFDGINRYDSIYHYCEKAFDVARKHNDTNYIAFTYTNLFAFNLHHAQAISDNSEKLDQCISLGLKALSFNDQIKIDRTIRAIWQMFLYMNLATAYIELGSEESINTALGYMKRVESIHDTTDFNYSDIIGLYKLRAALKSRSGEYEDAVMCYEMGLEEYNINYPGYDLISKYDQILFGIINKKSIQSVYDSLSKNYERLGNFRKALEFHVLSDEIEAEIFQEDKKNTISLLEADSENEKIENQITILEQDKQINELKINQSRYINIGVIALFVISVFIGVLYIRQVRYKNEYKSNILEQKLLRMQMNPHFIFNALSSIHNLVIKNNAEKASDYLINFSQLLRTSLESTTEDYMVLEDEISIIKSYLELQRLRHDYKFDFVIEVDREINPENTIIPPMLIQPFIENSIEHGIKHKPGKGHVNIKFIVDAKKVICEIDDDGIGREKARSSIYEFEKHKSLATGIIQERIKILNKKFHKRIRLDIIDKYSDTQQALGTMVRLELPFMSD